jgi:hypothetical protein
MHERYKNARRLLYARPPLHDHPWPTVAAGNPFLDPAEHERLVRELMSARRAVLAAGDSRARLAARHRVDIAKRALGERGEVWWDDGSPDYNRRLVGNTPYAGWFATRVSELSKSLRA